MSIHDVATCAPYAMGAAGDFASTRYAIGRAPSLGPGASGSEGNPLLFAGAQRVGVQAAVQLGYTGVGCWADLKLQRDGHKRLARVIRYTLLAAKLAIAVDNVRKVR